MTGSIPTVEMLRQEYEAQFGEKLADETASTIGGPVSLQRLRSARATRGLALSGGGIRSATFSLGVLQALAGYRLLTSFDYLSTVSGGGYIGGWLTTWAHRHPEGIGGVMEDLVPRPDLGHHEAAPIAHLRRYSNYLTPRVGLLSSDTWTIIGTYLRNLFVNWLSLVPYFALLLLVPIIGLHALDTAAGSSWIQVTWNGLSGSAILALVSISILVVSMAVLGISLPSSTVPGSDSSRIALVARTQEEFLIKAVAPLVIGGIGLATAWFTHATAVGAGETLQLPDLSPSADVSNWMLFAILGALAHGAAFAIAQGRNWYYTLTDSRRTLRETGATMLVSPVAVIGSGAFGGWVIWLAVAKILPALMAAASLPSASLLPTRVYVVLAVPLFLGGFVVGLAMYSAMASRRTSEEDREWFARAGAWILAMAVGWIAISGIALLGPSLLGLAWDRASAWLVSIGGLSGLVSMWLGGSGHTKVKDDPSEKTWATIAAEWALSLAAPVFVLLLAILLAAGLHGLQTFLADTWSISLLAAAGAIAAGCVVVIGLVNWLVNPNVFSLHGMYRDRLVRAYLGASRASRQPHKFTGFDQHDNVSLAHLAPPFFTAEDWPLVHAIAEALMTADDPAVREVVESADANLLADAVAIHTWSEGAVLRVVDRFNAVLIYSHDPAPLRQAWERLVRSKTPDTQFGPWDWNKLRRIAAALERGTAADAGDTDARKLYTILAGASEAAWPHDVRKLSVWSKHQVAALTERLNRVIAGYAPAGIPSGSAPGHTADATIRDALRTSGIPASTAELRDALDKLGPHRKPPFPIVNTALNLVSGDDLAWQERKAASFTMTPLHAGSPSVDFRGMVAHAEQKSCYGGTSGVSLGTAVTISGAAANPNMGYHSSPVVTILLTLFNARLGAWLGNPRDDKRFSHSCPRNQLIPMALTEALGLTHAGGAYVHLSDGGHFENLGLYELVRRGCRYILLCDGGCDQEYAFEDLGNAVRKIRIDLGIEIDFEGFRVGPQRPRTADGSSPPNQAGNYVAVGTIHYNKRAVGAARGKLLYIKPAVLEKQEEPVDVWQYGRRNPAYPHEPTTDQWFSESQFESYRALGEYIMRSVAEKASTQLQRKPATVEELFTGVEQYLRSGSPGPAVAVAGAGMNPRLP